MKIKAQQIVIETEDTHPSDTSGRPVVLLVMGLGMQLTAWPPALLQGLVDAGFRVLRLDNRDIGLSQHFDHLGTPNMVWQGFKYRMRLPIKAPYSLTDMATDTLGVLDAMNVAQAHVAGISMGGMIAQRLALLAPTRVASLTSIMSTSGARGLPGPQSEVMRMLLKLPAKGLDAAMEHTAQLLHLIASPAFPTPLHELREAVIAAAARNFHPQGVLRQMVAIAADSSRAAELSRITTPTLVIHGKADPLVPFACGVDTAKRIPGARLEAIEGMGHDLPPGVVERLLALMVPHFKAALPSLS